MEKNVEKSFIKIGLYFQIAYIVLMAITLCGFVICYGLIFGLFYLLSGSRADYLIVTIVISAIISIFVIILSIVPVIVLASDLFKERISKGVILIVLAIIALVLCNFVSAILWFVSAISILGRKKLVAAADTTTIQKSKGNANQASHKDTGKKELDSQDMMEHPEVKNPTTKNLEGFNEEIHKDEATTKVDSDNTEPPIESKDHDSKKD
ncbi:MFS transporter [Staphylococcus aureus]|uniref:MFS transporter n=1 Tax=Staphylococcus aureus TaxID=1280 RepID=UPI002DBF179D|nr:MFS transporter [Staphylococcus aureus]MEB6799289.1 MFS transporter [Staphylococcus aureus]MEB6815089.1 MFS transporter [Staphylococcus aureus]